MVPTSNTPKEKKRNNPQSIPTEVLAFLLHYAFEKDFKESFYWIVPSMIKCTFMNVILNEGPFFKEP